MRRLATVTGLVVFLATMVVGCASGPTPTPAPSSASPAAAFSPRLPELKVANGTTIPVTLLINGAALATIPPLSGEERVTASLPPFPWRIEARSPSGRSLLELVVESAIGIGGTNGRNARVDLSCGRLDVWLGAPLGGGPTFIPGPSGDCD